MSYFTVLIFHIVHDFHFHIAHDDDNHTVFCHINN